MSGLRVAKTLYSEGANGPGKRLVVWVQGCRLACPGCINPWSHPANGPAADWGTTCGPMLEALKAARELGCTGLTITGGEPFEQYLPDLDALVMFGQSELGSVGIFTGLTVQEIFQRHGAPGHGIEEVCAIFGRTDWMVTGRYRRDLPPGGPLCSSSNQHLLLLSNRHTLADFETTTEITFDMDTATAVKTGTLHRS